ncbi:MAG: hypothetical protein IJT00_05215 [Lachnospiraceae bacterium]|nr:hypothetical protein [Lachnospiraceae bacterium]
MTRENKAKIIGALASSYEKHDVAYDNTRTIEDVARENAIEFLHDICQEKRGAVSTTAVGRRYAR